MDLIVNLIYVLNGHAIFKYSRSAWSVGAICAVALPLTIVSAAKWENWVNALSRPPASGYDNITIKEQCTTFFNQLTFHDSIKKLNRKYVEKIISPPMFFK